MRVAVRPDGYELHIIRTAQDVRVAVRTWSSSAHARYDFMTEGFALEVKTTLKSAKRHRFSPEQLRPNADIRVYVASVMLIELPGGEAVPELIEEVYGGLDDPETRARFFRQCLRKGGADIYRSNLRLGTLPDGASIALDEANTLPVPAVHVGEPVSNVGFDLSGIEATAASARDQVLKFLGLSQ